MSNLADPQTFFAARRKLPIVNGKYQPSTPDKNDAGLKAQVKETATAQQPRGAGSATPVDQRSVSEATKDESSERLLSVYLPFAALLYFLLAFNHCIARCFLPSLMYWLDPY